MPNLIHLDRLCVVLVGVRNPLNIGAAARATSNFGFSSLRVVQPYEKAFREALLRQLRTVVAAMENKQLPWAAKTINLRIR